jgi:hypothetical protein
MICAAKINIFSVFGPLSVSHQPPKSLHACSSHSLAFIASIIISHAHKEFGGYRDTILPLARIPNLGGSS